MELARQRSEPGPKVAIVIVAFNNPSHLARCLESIFQDKFANLQTIVVDNSTNYDTPAVLPNRSDLHYQETTENIGFCAGCNLGIAKALELGADYVLLLNYDTVLRPGAISSLVARAESLVNPGIIGGKIYYMGSPDVLWYAGGRLSLAAGVGKHFGHNEKDGGNFQAGKRVTYVTGCCMLVPMGVFAKVGGLKEELFMYLDDAEFCLRVMKAGFELFYEPAAVLFHEVGPGMRRSSFPDYYLYFSIRNKPYITGNGFYRAYLRLYVAFLALSKLAVYGLTPGIQGRQAKVKAILYGYLDSFSLRPKYRHRFARLFRKHSR